MLRMTLDALVMVDAIDRRGSFTAAGEELHKVPSTVSYTVAKLEEDLGVSLFHRAGPKVRLTNAGRELLREGRELLRRAGDLECRVRRVATGWETELRLVCDSIFPAQHLCEGIAQFYKVADVTRMTLLSETMTGCWEALADGRADLLLAVGDAPPGGGYETRKLGQIEFVFCVAPSHPLARLRRRVSTSDLRNHKAVVVADSGRRLPPRTVGVLWDQDALTVPDMRTKFEYQVAGLGFGFLPEPCARDAAERGELVILKVEGPRKPEDILLAWRDADMGHALQWWVEYLSRPGLVESFLAREPARPGRDLLMPISN
jgi:DNA-binding transcriptional LysR family regulator